MAQEKETVIGQPIVHDYDEILFALRRITRAIDLHSKQLERKSGLTAPQLLVLQSVQRHGRTKPSTIARDILLSQATVTSIVDRLEKAGLVARERSTTDRRTVEVILCEKGYNKLRTAPDLLQAGFLRAFRELKQWERSQLVSSLQRIGEMMDIEDLDPTALADLGELADNENNS